MAAVLRSADPPADLKEFRISEATARRARVAHRREVADRVKHSFNPPTHGIVHWDGKNVMVRISDTVKTYRKISQCIDFLLIFSHIKLTDQKSQFMCKKMVPLITEEESK